MDGCTDLDLAGIVSARLFSRDECARLIDELKLDSAWKEAKVTSSEHRYDGYLDKRFRDARHNSLPNLPALKARIQKKIRKDLIPQLNERFGTGFEGVDELGAVHYRRGGHFSIHIDNGTGYEHRRFSVVVYLNDVDSGGETWFPDIDECVRPSAGHAIVFPSDYRHQSMPVLQGEKWVFVCWIWGNEPIEWI